MATKVFVSYAHLNRECLSWVLPPFQAIPRFDFDVWDDSRIQVGTPWLAEIERALQEARIALLLISSEFLTSQFITNMEVPTLLKLRRSQNTRVIPIFVRPSPWTQIQWLAELQGCPAEKSLAEMSDAERTAAMVKLAIHLDKVMHGEPTEAALLLEQAVGRLQIESNPFIASAVAWPIAPRGFLTSPLVTEEIGRLRTPPTVRWPWGNTVDRPVRRVSTIGRRLPKMVLEVLDSPGPAVILPKIATSLAHVSTNAPLYTLTRGALGQQSLATSIVRPIQINEPVIGGTVLHMVCDEPPLIGSPIIDQEERVVGLVQQSKDRFVEGLMFDRSTLSLP